jgi:peptidoglycan/LPS O-acetylase OafA/YrhL
MKYRTEIDGLRALAVFPVILFATGYLLQYCYETVEVALFI